MITPQTHQQTGLTSYDSPGYPREENYYTPPTSPVEDAFHTAPTSPFQDPDEKLPENSTSSDLFIPIRETYHSSSSSAKHAGMKKTSGSHPANQNQEILLNETMKASWCTKELGSHGSAFLVQCSPQESASIMEYARLQGKTVHVADDSDPYAVAAVSNQVRQNSTGGLENLVHSFCKSEFNKTSEKDCFYSGKISEDLVFETKFKEFLNKFNEYIIKDLLIKENQNSRSKNWKITSVGTQPINMDSKIVKETVKQRLQQFRDGARLADCIFPSVYKYIHELSLNDSDLRKVLLGHESVEARRLIREAQIESGSYQGRLSSAEIERQHHTSRQIGILGDFVSTGSGQGTHSRALRLIQLAEILSKIKPITVSDLSEEQAGLTIADAKERVELHFATKRAIQAQKEFLKELEEEEKKQKTKDKKKAEPKPQPNHQKTSDKKSKITHTPALGVDLQPEDKFSAPIRPIASANSQILEALATMNTGNSRIVLHPRVTRWIDPANPTQSSFRGYESENPETWLLSLANHCFPKLDRFLNSEKLTEAYTFKATYKKPAKDSVVVDVVGILATRIIERPGKPISRDEGIIYVAAEPKGNISEIYHAYFELPKPNAHRLTPALLEVIENIREENQRTPFCTSHTDGFTPVSDASYALKENGNIEVSIAKTFPGAAKVTYLFHKIEVE